MSTIGKRYGYKKDKVDPRDFKLTFAVKPCQTAIQLVDLRHHCPPVYNQGGLGSCTANAIAGLYEFDEMQEKEPKIFTPSRLFIYYNERVMEGTINEDNGAEIRNGMKTINSVGVCPEANWPYVESAFAKKPPAKLYALAKKHKCVQYKRLNQSVDQLKQCLIEGFPFVFGMMVFPEFESVEVANTGVLPMPVVGSQPIGGHAVMCVGFDEIKKIFIVRNSWGVEWGDHGYFYMPYAYMLSPDLACDFWTATRVNDAPIVDAPVAMVMKANADIVTNTISDAGTAAIQDIVTDVTTDVQKEIVEVEEQIEQITAQIKMCCIPCCKIVSK
jgi:C1A family cysteine protease